MPPLIMPMCEEVELSTSNPQLAVVQHEAQAGTHLYAVQGLWCLAAYTIGLGEGTGVCRASMVLTVVQARLRE